MMNSLDFQGTIGIFLTHVTYLQIWLFDFGQLFFTSPCFTVPLESHPLQEPGLHRNLKGQTSVQNFNFYGNTTALIIILAL